MPNFEVNLMIDAESLIWKIDTFAVEKLVLANEAAAAALDRDTGVMLICRKHWEYPQYDHWVKKGVAYYNVIVPYEKALSEATSKEQLTVICSDLVIDCLSEWAEKRRKKAMRISTKKAA